MSDEPRATVRSINGQLVLDDPDALAVAKVVAKHNCRILYAANADAGRIAHFSRRCRELGRSPANTVMVIINVDDPHGRLLADQLMPGQDAYWQSLRDSGQIPVARGLAVRKGVEDFLGLFDKAAAARLRAATDLAVVVVDCGVAEVFGVAP